MRNFSSYRAHNVKLLTLNAKNRNKLAILNFFWPLLNLSENWLLVTCITNLGRIHEKLKLSRPKVNVNADANATHFNCNSPPFLIKIKRWANDPHSHPCKKIQDVCRQPF